MWTPQAFAQTEAPVVEERNEIVVTATRRDQNVQDVPIAVSVLGAELLENTGTSTVAQITQLQPTLQLISSNARNTATLIRGLGSNYGLTNDGLELGVGIYVDDVYYARPGAAALDYYDIQRVEILRGPQGTLFGKNTTAGAINIVTRAPTFEPEGSAEFSIGDWGFTQIRGTFSGPLIDNLLAGRVTVGAVQRDGFLNNVTTGTDQDSLDNRSVRLQLLYTPVTRSGRALARGLRLARPRMLHPGVRALRPVAPARRAPVSRTRGAFRVRAAEHKSV